MIFQTRRAAIYQEPNTLESVAQYHHLFQLPIPSSPTLPDSERCQLIVSLLQKEIQSLKKAVQAKKSLVDAANALANLQYAIGRAVLEFGMAGLFLSMFDEVHRSHMSKICNSLSEAQATQRFHRSKKGMESIIETVVPVEDAATQSKWLVLRQKDQKMLKSVKYAPANLAALVTKAMEAADSAAPIFFMASPSGLSSVAEYHTSLTGSPPPSSSPQWPSRCSWRLNILESKLKELQQALGAKEQPKDTLIKIAHSLTNMQYNLSGAVLEFGFASKFQSIFDEVHRSHMSEACLTEEEAKETIRHYYLQNSRQSSQEKELPTGTIPESPEEDKEEEEEDDYYYLQQPQGGGSIKFLVYQQGTNQALKSIKYKPADLDRILIPSS